jgi:hypothetical protein
MELLPTYRDRDRLCRRKDIYCMVPYVTNCYTFFCKAMGDPVMAD